MAGTLDNSKIIQVYLTDANGNPGSIPAPVGGALETTQAAGNVSLSSLDTKMTANNTKLDTLITALAAANASLDDIEAVAESTAPTVVSVFSSEYETVAASQTDQIMGATGAIGDAIEAILVTPTSTTVGAISIEDGSTNTVVYTGGTVGADLKPFVIPLFGIKATTATGWEITTGAGMSLLVFGQFT